MAKYFRSHFEEVCVRGAVGAKVPFLEVPRRFLDEKAPLSYALNFIVNLRIRGPFALCLVDERLIMLTPKVQE